MNAEEVIRKEAQKFYENKVERSFNSNPIDDFKEVKYRLSDFYTSESKAIFLDEIELVAKQKLKK